MTVDAAEPGLNAGHDLAQTVKWLGLVGQRHDLSLPPPPGRRPAAIGILLDAISRDFAEYRDVVLGARDAARRNGEQLDEVVRATGEQGDLVRATAAAATEAGHGAELMAQAAEALNGFTQSAAGAAGEAGANLRSIDAALATLAVRLIDGQAPLAAMRASTGGVADFLLTLSRLSRHAQLLGVNAQIEAAHLAEAGSRFGIVAQEVRKLSASTRESKADVKRIVDELRESTEHVAVAMNDSKEATASAEHEITGAGDALAQTGRGIDEFGTMVATVAGVAATQRTALHAIRSSVELISRRADEAAGASREAAHFDLDALLERAQTRANTWTLRDRPAPVPLDGDAFERWIAAIIGGSSPADPLAAGADPADLRLAAAVRALLDIVAAEQRALLGDVVQAAVAISRNSYAWRAIAAALEAVGVEIDLVRTTVAESAASARTSAELAGAMRSLVDTIRSQYDSALEQLDDALARISRITASVGEIDGFVVSMGAAAARADRIMGLIESLSAETDLLSLNAAIEAAHAGELGYGFGVIAEEIRSLARSTNESTLNVSRLVSTITEVSGNLQTSIGEAAASTGAVVASADGVRSAIENLRGSFESATARALDVSTTASEQNRALDRVLENVNRASSAFDLNAAVLTDKGRVNLARIGSRAHAIAARRPLGTVAERVRALTERLCGQVEAAIDEVVAGGRVSYDRLFDFRYEPIAGERIASLARLFDVSRVPETGFTPPKFATPWDAAIDEALIDVLSRGWEQALAADISPVAIFLCDLNGFFYAYPRQKIAAWTNDEVADNIGNRIKRIFEDDYTMRVVRWGLGPKADAVGLRAPYDAFRQARCNLERTGQRPWGGYVYARDTNIVCNEVAMGTYVRDARHGTLRVCYDHNLI